MIDSIIRFSIQNKFFVGLLVVGLIVWGGYSARHLPIDALPDITNNQVQVITTAPTLASQEVERSITFPLEQALATLPRVEEIRSISRFGLSVITVVFEEDVDNISARQQVWERVSQAQDQIPPGLARPELGPMSTGLGEIYQYILRPKKGYEKLYPAMELRSLQDWVVRRQLLGTPGVADVSSIGGYLKQYEVAISPDRLRAVGISMADVFTALETNNANTGGAYIDKRPNAYFIRGLGLVEKPEDIENIAIPTARQGVPLVIRDLADIRDGHAVRYGAMTRNGEGEAVGGIVLMLKGENSAQVISRVKERMKTIQASLPKGVVLEPFLDRTHLVERAIGTVEKNLIEGGLIVVFVLVLFLGNLRAGLVVASVIPLSLLFALGCMRVFGVSGNLMSLGAIDFGIIVDGAVIIVEAVLHHIQTTPALLQKGSLTQAEMNEEVEAAAVKIRSSAAFGEIIILIVYLPLLALIGIEGKMFRPMAETVSFAIAGAFLLSLTYVPAASALFLSKKAAHKRNFSDRFMDALQRLYAPAIRAVLRARVLTVFLAIALLGGAMWLFSTLGGEFIPTLDEGDYALECRLQPGASLSQTVETSTLVGQLLTSQIPEVKEVISKIGASEIPTDPMPVEAADVMVVMKDRKDWSQDYSREEMAEKITKVLSAVPGVDFGVQQPIQMRFNELISGSRQDVAIKIYGEDLDELATQAGRVRSSIVGIEGVKDIYLEKVTGLPQIQVRYNRPQLARYGVSVDDVNRALSSAFAGAVAGVVFEGERRYDLVVRLSEAARDDISQVGQLYVPLPNGGQVQLSELAQVTLEDGPQQVSREDARRRITVGFNVRGRDVESVVEEIQAKLASRVKLPPGYFIRYGGQFENLIEARDRLVVAVPVALGLILVLLYITFGSASQALLIFSAVPFSAIGGVLALWLRGMPFSISAGVGFIALFGVAVLNGIVLIGQFNQLKKDGEADIVKRVLEGTKIRLRPVLMTATVASLGFMPMALSGSAGAEVQRPLATVVIGGLVSATLLTLLVLPVLYVLEERLSRRFMKSSAAVLVMLLIGWPNAANAQTGQLIPNAAFNSLLQNLPQTNAQLRAGGFEGSSLLYRQRASFELPRTSLSVLYGQYNTINIDNSFTLTQGFQLPWVYSSRRRLAGRSYERQQAQQSVLRSGLTRDAAQALYQAWYEQSRVALLARQDSQLRALAFASKRRYQTGEGTLLESVSTQAQADLAGNALRQAETQVERSRISIKAILQSSTGPDIPSTPLDELSWSVPDTNASAEAHPTVRLARSEIALAQSQVALDRKEFVPDFTLGYFNQSLTGTQEVDGAQRYFSRSYRFQGIQAGIALPLFFSPLRRRVEASRFAARAAEAQAENAKVKIRADIRRALLTLTQQRASLEYFRNSGLPQARLIQQQSQRAFQAGEISYVERLQSARTALEIELGYLDALNNVNQTILELEYLTGNLSK